MQRHASKIVAIALLAGLFVPLAWWQGRPATPEVEPDAPRQNIFLLTPGECFDAPDADRLTDVEPVPCEARHRYEIFAVTASINDVYDEPVLASEANAFCVDMFNRYTGEPLGSSSLEVIHLIPSEASWDDGLNRISCALADASGTLTGSRRG